MANEKQTNVSAAATPQGQQNPSEKADKDAQKVKASGFNDTDEIQFFDTTVAKLVERENPETGEKEWIEVMSDNLYPGEKLKRADDEEKAEEKAKKARGDRAKENEKNDKK